MANLGKSFLYMGPDTMPCDRCGAPRIIGHWRLWPCLQCDLPPARKDEEPVQVRTVSVS